jgi:hypothetical protein
MATDYVAILTLLGGSGVIVSLATLLYNWRQSVIQSKIQDRREALQRDFEVRRDAKDYYMNLYAYVAILLELATGYRRSIESEQQMTAILSFKDKKYEKYSSQQILIQFQDAYQSFSKFYIEKKQCGYEIFIPPKLAVLLIEFWKATQIFHDDPETLSNNRAIDNFKQVCAQLTDCMEKLYGMKVDDDAKN